MKILLETRVNAFKICYFFRGAKLFNCLPKKSIIISSNNLITRINKTKINF